MPCCATKKCLWISIIAGVAAAAALAIGLGVGLGLKKTSGQKLTVGQVSSVAQNTLTKRRLHKRLTISQIAPSSSSFAFAEVLGYKVEVRNIAFNPVTQGQEVATTTFTTPQLVEISPTGVNVTVDANIAASSYSYADVNVYNRFSVKAVCKTANYLVYTAKDGIKRVSLATTTLTDLDYYFYPFAWPSISTSATVNNTNENSFRTRASFTIEKNSTSVNVLMDTTYTLLCFDGVYTNGDTSLAPFVFGAPKVTDYFPTDKPNFGLLEMPVAVYLGSNADLVTSQHFLVASTAGGLQDPIQPLNVLIVTIVYRPDGSFLSASGRNDNRNSSDIQTIFSLKSETATLITLNSCGFYASQQLIVKNRIVTGISKSHAVGAVVQYNVTDNDDCGKSFIEMGENRSLNCTGASTTSYWKRFK